MERKRSKGVTFWAWWFIVGGILGLAGTIKYYRTAAFPGSPFLMPFLVQVAFIVVSLTCGILLLQLKESGRKGTILLCCAYFLLYSYLTIHWWQSNKIVVERMLKYDKVARVKSQEQANMKLVRTSAGSAVFPLIPIYFLTRPKVKEQFEDKES